MTAPDLSVRRSVPSFGRRSGSGRAFVIIQHATHRGTTGNRSATLARTNCFEEDVPQSLMIPFVLIMRDVFGNRPSKVALAERDDSIEALCFDRPQLSNRCT